MPPKRRPLTDKNVHESNLKESKVKLWREKAQQVKTPEERKRVGEAAFDFNSSSESTAKKKRAPRKQKKKLEPSGHNCPNYKQIIEDLKKGKITPNTQKLKRKEEANKFRQELADKKIDINKSPQLKTASTPLKNRRDIRFFEGFECSAIVGPSSPDFVSWEEQLPLLLKTSEVKPTASLTSSTASKNLITEINSCESVRYNLRSRQVSDKSRPDSTVSASSPPGTSNTKVIGQEKEEKNSPPDKFVTVRRGGYARKLNLNASPESSSSCSPLEPIYEPSGHISESDHSSNGELDLENLHQELSPRLPSLPLESVKKPFVKPTLKVDGRDYFRSSVTAGLSRISTTQATGDETFQDSHYSSFVLKGGKHNRARALIRNIRSGRLTLTLENDSFAAQNIGKRGRGFQSFVGEVIDRQMGKNTIIEESFNLQSAISDSTCMRVPEFYNRRETLLRVVPEVSLDKEHDALYQALGLFDDAEKSDIWTARDELMKRCNQREPLPFDEYFNEYTLPNCKKIGEGVYGEVFAYDSMEDGPIVFKIIPIEGDTLFNDEPQKTFREILSEVLITMELSNLRKGDSNRTNGFIELKRVRCMVGRFPLYLHNLWYEYDSEKRSDNDDPEKLPQDQLYIIFELANGGSDLEAFVFNSAEESKAAFKQITISFAVAEQALQFEHRDFHWGNVLISRTEEKEVFYTLDGQEHRLPTNGVKVSIIDFTLSRMSYKGCSIYNDLALDPTLFTSVGEYQFEIYRLMKTELENNWQQFKPRTNILWLHYTLLKMVGNVRYAVPPTNKAHSLALTTLRLWEKRVLSCSDSNTFFNKIK